MKFLKTVGKIILGCVLLGMITYEVLRVDSNLNKGANTSNMDEYGQIVSVKEISNKLSANNLQSLSAFVNLNCNSLTEKYDTTVKSEYIKTVMNETYNVEFAEYDIYVQGNVYKKVFIAPFSDGIKVIYKDGTENTIEDLFAKIETELILINETAKEQINNMVNNTALIPDEIVEEELPNDLFGSSREESWHQVVEPIGDNGFEININEDDALNLMKEVFPDSKITLIETRENDYIFSVVSNNTGNPEDNIYEEYTVSNNFPEVYDMTGNCIYSK